MLRNVGALLLGALVGFCWNMALGELTFGVLFPIPPNLGMDIPDQVGGHIRRLPTAAFLLMMAAHLGQSPMGG